MPNRFLDPVVVAQLGNLEIRSRRILEGLYSGHHINRNRGTSKEFSEHRPYNPGDDLKGIDWKVYGRTDRLVIKQYDEETNILGTIIFDDSRSMNYSWGGRISKLEYAKTMAAALAYLLVSQHDAVGLLSTDQSLPPHGGRGYLEKFFESLDQIQAKGVWNVESLATSLGTPLKKRALIMVFSDLMADSQKVISTLRALHARKNEVIVFQILDPAEKELPYQGSVLFEDMETGELLKTEPEAIREVYRNGVQNKLAVFAHLFRSSGLEYVNLTTDTPFDKGMGAYLSWRGAFV